MASERYGKMVSPKSGREIFYSLGDIAEKNDRVGIGVVELVPNGRAGLVADKIGDQRGLAAARIGRDHGDRGIKVETQFFGQTGAFEKLGNRSGGSSLVLKKKFGRCIELETY